MLMTDPRWTREETNQQYTRTMGLITNDILYEDSVLLRANYQLSVHQRRAFTSPDNGVPDTQPKIFIDISHLLYLQSHFASLIDL